MYVAKEVCRIAKIKSAGDLGGAYLHNLRLQATPNADASKASYNIELTDRSPDQSYLDIFHERIEASPWYKDGNHKIAKNAIYAAEFMLTFGGEAIDQIDIDTWAQDNYEWLCSHFGGKENVISAILHTDERTPHIHAIVLPFDEKGKLSYTKYLGGSKYRLSEIQDLYHEEVGNRHNLERGMKGSKATHQDIDNFYSLVNETVTPITLPEPEQKTGLFRKGETALEYQERVNTIVQQACAIATAKESENKLLKKRIANIEHLQEGVVPNDQYLEIVEKHNALSVVHEKLQSAYDSLKAKYDKIKKQLNTLKKDYDALSEKYNVLQKKYKTLQSHSSHSADLNWENNLMYTLLTNLNQAFRIDKCRAAHSRGETSMEEKMINATRKSQVNNKNRQQSQPTHSSNRSQYLDR